MTNKITRSIFLGVSLILAALVPITEPIWYNSLSAHADASNEIIYNAMHIFSALFFFLNAHAQKRQFDYVIGLGMVSILLTNMYDYPLLHNLCTGLTIALALFSMLYYCSKRNRVVNLFMAVSCAVVFFVGYLSTDIYFAFAEIVVMWIVGIHMFRRIWLGERE